MSDGATHTEPIEEHIYYDGHCGACHRTVDFVSKRDAAGRFRYAPLQGPTFLERVPETERVDLPDSVIVHTADGRLLDRSRGVVHILRALGGGWAFLGTLLWLVPRPLRDLAYDLFARVRHKVFARPEQDACPLPPGHLRGRLDP